MKIQKEMDRQAREQLRKSKAEAHQAHLQEKREQQKAQLEADSEKYKE